MLNPDYGDITDPEEGTDLVINYGKPPGAQFPQTNITPRRRTSPLAKTTEQSAAWLDTIPDTATLFDRKTPQEVQEMLDEFLLGEEDAEETSTEANKYDNASSTDKVDKAFAELLAS